MRTCLCLDRRYRCRTHFSLVLFEKYTIYEQIYYTIYACFMAYWYYHRIRHYTETLPGLNGTQRHTHIFYWNRRHVRAASTMERQQITRPIVTTMCLLFLLVQIAYINTKHNALCARDDTHNERGCWMNGNGNLGFVGELATSAAAPRMCTLLPKSNIKANMTDVTASTNAAPKPHPICIPQCATLLCTGRVIITLYAWHNFRGGGGWRRSNCHERERAPLTQPETQRTFVEANEQWIPTLYRAICVSFDVYPSVHKHIAIHIFRNWHPCPLYCLAMKHDKLYTYNEKTTSTCAVDSSA